MHPQFLDAVHHLPVYQCSRDRDADASTSCLWLFKTPEGYWQANSAPLDCEDPTQGIPVFRTLNPDVNATLPGWYQWQAWERGARRYEVFFETTTFHDV